MRKILINLRFINIAFMFIMTNMFICNAQDVKPDKIFKNDGTKIESKVLEITPNEIKYKKFSNLDGPTYTILKSEIFLVEYANGDTEKMTDVPKQTASPTTNSNPEKIQNKKDNPTNELVGLQAFYGKSMSITSIDLSYCNVDAYDAIDVDGRFRFAATYAILGVFKKAVAMGGGFGTAISVGEHFGYDFPLFYNIRIFPTEQFFIDVKMGPSLWLNSYVTEVNYGTWNNPDYYYVEDAFIKPAFFSSLNIGYNFNEDWGLALHSSVLHDDGKSIQLTAGMSILYTF